MRVDTIKCDSCNGTGRVKENNRSSPQNNAMHLFFSQLSDKLNEMGLDVTRIMKPTYEIWWTSYMVKEILWKFFQKKKFGKDSTVKLNKSDEITAIHEDLMRNLGEKYHVEYIPFPHKCKKCHHIDCIC